MMDWDNAMTTDIGEAIQESQKQGITNNSFQKLKKHYLELEEFTEKFDEANNVNIDELIERLHELDSYLRERSFND